jgi:hypothetical protein
MKSAALRECSARQSKRGNGRAPARRPLPWRDQRGRFRSLRPPASQTATRRGGSCDARRMRAGRRLPATIMENGTGEYCTGRGRGCGHNSRYLSGHSIATSLREGKPRGDFRADLIVVCRHEGRYTGCARRSGCGSGAATSSGLPSSKALALAQNATAQKTASASGRKCVRWHLWLGLLKACRHSLEAGAEGI